MYVKNKRNEIAPVKLATFYAQTQSQLKSL